MKDVQHLRCLLLAFVAICTLSMEAQTLEVVSPLIHEGSVAAASCPNDNNGNPCARIIIELPLEDVEVTGAYIMGNVKEKTGRYELFVSVPKKQGQKITLRHSQYNSLDIPLWTSEGPLLGREAYRVVVSAPQSATTVTDMHGNQVDLTGNFEVIKHEDLGGQYLVITSEPQESSIYIDGNLVSSGKGSASKMLPYGVHTYRVEAPMYDTEEGRISMGQEKQTLKVALKPAFGFLYIASSPEDRAVVYIDGAKVGLTPYKSQALAEGQHSVRVEKEMYKTVEQNIQVIRTQTTTVNLSLIPTFATITIISKDADARIHIDDRQMGKGRWSGRLSEGLHKISVRRVSHREIVKTINAVPNTNDTISIEALTPIYGTLHVVTDPIGAQVIIDGNAVGETPCILNNVLTGEHQILLSLAGYETVTRNLSIEEGRVQTLDHTLEKRRSQSAESQRNANSRDSDIVIWHTVKKGETLYRIAQQYGVTTETILQYNDANIKVGNKLKIVKKGTSRSNLSSNSTSTGSTGSQPKTNSSTENRTPANSHASNSKVEYNVNGVKFNMIPVEGGTFTMGATGKLDAKANKNEKPTHQVTLSNYMIGETEVTQALWNAVMGKNPSRQKGDSFPVDYVSWNDCQEFIRKLNSLSGQKFRLPTEAEWEYAAKGGTKAHGYLYSGSDDEDKVAWHYHNSGRSYDDVAAHAVASLAPNELGIYDMTGSVWEFCSDKYGDYPSGPQVNPQGGVSDYYVVIRGGSRSHYPDIISRRKKEFPDAHYSHRGLRLAMDSSSEKIAARKGNRNSSTSRANQDEIVKSYRVTEIIEKDYTSSSIKRYRGDSETTIVDLGLPSGTLWSCRDVKDGDSETSCYIWNMKGELGQKIQQSESSIIQDKILDSKGHLLSKYDIASKKMGGEWKTPTLEEFEELITHCTWTLVKYNRLSGHDFLSGIYQISGPKGHIFLDGKYLDSMYLNSTYQTCTLADGAGLNYYIELDGQDILIKKGKVDESHSVRPVRKRK